VTGRHRGLKRKIQAGYTVPSLQWCAMCRQSYFCLLADAECKGHPIFQHPVWHRMISLRYACNRRAGIILIPRLPLCQISFLSHLRASPWRTTAYSINHIAHSVTHSPSLKLSLRKSVSIFNVDTII